MCKFVAYFLDINYYLHPEVLILVSNTTGTGKMDIVISESANANDIMNKIEHYISITRPMSANSLHIEVWGEKAVENEAYLIMLQTIMNSVFGKLGVYFNSVSRFYMIDFDIMNFMEREKKEINMIIQVIIDIVNTIKSESENFTNITNMANYIRNTFSSNRKIYRTIQEQFQLKPSIIVDRDDLPARYDDATLYNVQKAIQESGRYVYLRTGIFSKLLGCYTNDLPSMWNFEYNNMFTKDFGFTLPLQSILSEIPDFKTKIIDNIKKTHDKTIEFYQKIQNGKLKVNKDKVNKGYLFNLYNLNKALFNI